MSWRPPSDSRKVHTNPRNVEGGTRTGIGWSTSRTAAFVDARDAR